MPFGPYALYGLAFESDLECPELPLSTRAADVHVRYGVVPAHLEAPDATGARFEASPGHYLFHIESIGRFLATRGRVVTIDRACESHDRDVRMMLLGPVFAAVLHQRGMLVLHAAALSVDSRAVLIAGHSGSGKSTLLAALLKRGRHMLTDDVSAISLDEATQPIVHAGVPQLRLWADAAERLGQSTSSLEKVQPSFEKYVVPTTPQFVGGHQAVKAIYFLRPEDDAPIEIERQTGATRLAAIWSYTYGRQMIEGLGMRPAYFGLATAVANRVPVVRITRPRAPFLLTELADRIDAELG